LKAVRRENDAINSSRSAMRGVITRQKKQIAELKAALGKDGGSDG
jgi:hypothetical protein